MRKIFGIIRDRISDTNIRRLQEKNRKIILFPKREISENEILIRFIKYFLEGARGKYCVGFSYMLDYS